MRMKRLDTVFVTGSGRLGLLIYLARAGTPARAGRQAGPSKPARPGTTAGLGPAGRKLDRDLGRDGAACFREDAAEVA